MKILTSPASPFGRKVRMTALLKGLGDRIAVEDMGAADAVHANPLAKIPVLITDEGTSIFDSPVICEYLDAQVASPVLFPGEGARRWQTLTLAALADGIIDAAILLVYEGRYRPEDKRVQAWVDMQQSKIDRALSHIESAPPELGATPTYGDITLACALGYLDFRHGGAWRNGHPKTVQWLQRFEEAVPAFRETAPPAA